MAIILLHHHTRNLHKFEFGGQVRGHNAELKGETTPRQTQQNISMTQTCSNMLIHPCQYGECDKLKGL